VHVRRGDFTAACGHVPADECFQPLAVYARRVAEVAATLNATRGLSVPPDHVLVTSDETDPKWWEEVAAMGWRWVDHVGQRTEALYGQWYVPLVDAVRFTTGWPLIFTGAVSKSDTYASTSVRPDDSR